jgi:hypothetical protein
VWSGIFAWLGYTFVPPASLTALCRAMVSLSNNKKIKSGLLLVWHTTVWVLWTTRNQKLFDDKDSSDAEMVSEIKQLA